jgi:hypothetical protein
MPLELSTLTSMRKLIVFLLFIFVFISSVGLARAKAVPTPTPTPSPIVTATPEVLAPDITQKTRETLDPLETLLKNQTLGSVWPSNLVKYAIRGAVASGVPVNTIVLLLLLPIVTFTIAFSRNVVGIRGFGIFLPAALSVVFVAIGPVVGIGLFLVIVLVSTVMRMILRKLKIKLQYLPRMSLILWAVVLGVLAVLFAAPLVHFPGLANVSIFAVLILILLAEDFIRVQLGKSVKTALNLTTETLILALISYFVLTLGFLQRFVLLNPEMALIGAGLLDFILAKYSGLRLMEIYRFRKLIGS